MNYPNQYIELCLEGSSSVFKGLNQKDKEILSQHHGLVVVNKGDFLFREGERTRGLLCLMSGKVKVVKTGVGAREQILRMTKPDEIIGFRVLFSENTWSVSAIAIENSTLCLLEKRSIVRILKKNADLGFRLLKLVSEELWYSYDRTVSLTQKHVRGRVAESLLILSDIYGFEPEEKTIAVSLSREEIANLSSMTPSNAIRTLSNFANEGIIRIKGRKITITDLDSLMQISELG
jgi:CRP-like cAMP-binding protein